MEEFFVTTKDNKKIAFNHCQNGGDSVLVIAPGWFMTKDTKQFRDITLDFSKYTDVICMDFRGHGSSEGRYTFSAYEEYDLAAVVDYAKKQYKTVNLLGFSLGGTVSILYCAEHDTINSLITVSAPSDFYKVENKMWHPNAFVPTIKKWIENEKNKIKPRKIRIHSPFLHKKKAVEEISKIKIPHLLIAGEKDPTVSAKHTKRLFENCVQNAQTEIFENCFHAEDIYFQAHDMFMERCLKFLK